MRQHRAPLRSTLLALGLLAGLTLQAPTHAADDLAQTAKGTIAPADIRMNNDCPNAARSSAELCPKV